MEQLAGGLEVAADHQKIIGAPGTVFWEYWEIMYLKEKFMPCTFSTKKDILYCLELVLMKFLTVLTQGDALNIRKIYLTENALRANNIFKLDKCWSKVLVNKNIA